MLCFGLFSFYLPVFYDLKVALLLDGISFYPNKYPNCIKKTLKKCLFETENRPGFIPDGFLFEMALTVDYALSAARKGAASSS